MIRISLTLALASIIFSASPSAAAEKPELLSVQKVWDRAPHNAFTDLIQFNGRWLCAFREGNAHVSEDGTIQILSSADSTNWLPWARVTLDRTDLRDPKLCITPAGELMLTTAGAFRLATPVVHESLSWLTREGKHWTGPFLIGETNMWLWRVTWHKDTAYSVGYDTAAEKFVRLYSSKNGTNFQALVPKLFDRGYPNESGMTFLPDDTALCLLRRDGTESSGQLGQARPPYTDWTWKDLGVKIGGPALIRLPDGRLIAGVRLYDGKVRTAIVEIHADSGKLTELLALPSGGDNSYAGLVWHENTLFVSYYSSHEGKSAIYLARVKL
ncbi:MAG TPA: exo-alpha-sialidase [Verrucomicrobiae bacterium]